MPHNGSITRGYGRLSSSAKHQPPYPFTFLIVPTTHQHKLMRKNNYQQSVTNSIGHSRYHFMKLSQWVPKQAIHL